MSYYDLYKKRLNRYGEDYSSRIQGQREREFEEYLLKSVYRVDFSYNGEIWPGVLELNKQDQTQTVQYLLVRLDADIPNGTILEIPKNLTETNHWLVWWTQEQAAGGYKKLVVLRLNHEISWVNGDETYTQWGYFYGPGATTIQDTLKSASKGSRYLEDTNLYMFITAANENLTKDTYFEITENNLTQAYNVTGLDFHSTSGVVYVSVDPVYVRSHIDPSDTIDDGLTWLNGGRTNGSA